MAYCETCARHKALKVLKDAGAWEEIIVPTFQNVGTEEEEDDGTAIVPSGTRSIFTEGLLRNILDLDPGQQLFRHLGQLLADSGFAPHRAFGFSDRIRGVGGVAFVSNGQLVR